MSSTSTVYFLNLISKNIFGAYSTPVVPSSYYIGVSSTAPTTTGGGATEPTSSVGYSRIQIQNKSTNFTQSGTGVATNTNDYNFPESTGNWGQMTHYVVFDSLTGGNLLAYGTLSTPRTVETGTTLTLKAGQFQLSFVNPAA